MTTVSVVRSSPSALDVSHWQDPHPMQLEARACHLDLFSCDDFERPQVSADINDAARLCMRMAIWSCVKDLHMKSAKYSHFWTTMPLVTVTPLQLSSTYSSLILGYPSLNPLRTSYEDIPLKLKV